jgi:hypothetical protein
MVNEYCFRDVLQAQDDLLDRAGFFSHGILDLVARLCIRLICTSRPVKMEEG